MKLLPALLLLSSASLISCASGGFKLRPATPEDTLRLSVNWDGNPLERESAELAESHNAAKYEEGIWRKKDAKLPLLTLEYYETGFDKVLTERARKTPDKIVKRWQEKGNIVAVGDLSPGQNGLGPLDYTRIQMGSVKCVHFNQFWADQGAVKGLDIVRGSKGHSKASQAGGLYTVRIVGLYCEESEYALSSARLNELFHSYRLAGLPFD